MDLAELRDSSRSKADEQTESFIPNVELDRFINQGARLIHGKIVQSFNNHYTIVGTVGNGGLFNTVANQQAYSFPATLKKLIKVEVRFNGSTNDNDWVGLERLNLSNDSMQTYYPIREGYSPLFGYVLVKTGIHIRPVPTEIFEVRLWFIENFVALEDPTDIPDIPEEYHDLISEFAAIQCLRKSGEGIYKEAMDVFNLELSNLIGTVDFRDQQPEQMVITEDEWDY